MKYEHNEAPCRWRAGHGYEPPSMGNKPPRCASKQCCVPATLPVHPTPICCGHGSHSSIYHSVSFPLGHSPLFALSECHFPAAYYYGGLPQACLPWQTTPVPPAPTIATTDNGDSDSETGSNTISTSVSSDGKTDVTAPGSKLPGGVRLGTGILYTGRPCHLHVIDGSKVSMHSLVNNRKAAQRFHFTRRIVQDNSTVREVITALGGAEGASVTQIWEWGEGYWKKGSEMKSGGDKAEQRLKDIGWTDAGSRNRAPVWLYFAKK